MEDLLEKMTKEDLYDFVANNYCDMSKEQLKEVTLSILVVVYDTIAYSDDEAWKAFEKRVYDEYNERNDY